MLCGKNISQKLVSGPTFSIHGRKMFAKLVSRQKRLSVSTSTRLQTSHSSPTMPSNLWARSSDNVLSSWQYQLSRFCNCWSCWARKMTGAELCHLAHSMSPHLRLVSAHISQWDVKFASKWDSALKGNSALGAHVARAVGIELAHNEGQYVIICDPFFCGTCGKSTTASKHIF